MELDWEAQYEALGNMRRAVVHHSPLVVPVMHNFVLAIIPAIESLRFGDVHAGDEAGEGGWAVHR